jgi:hypothetical protein
VLAQTRTPEKQVARPNEYRGQRADGQSEKKVGAQRQSLVPVKERPRTPVAPQRNKTAAVVENRPKLGVAIENFRVFPVTGSHNLRIQFKLKNTSENSQRVSGHAIVVLKGRQVEQSRWLSIPRLPLVDGRPAGNQRGYAFGINYFRTMRFTAPKPRFAEKYDTASVYVYTRAGQLLLEQDFAVNLPSAPKRSTGPASPDALLKVLKNTEQ